jgi:hypothetical protein
MLGVAGNFTSLHHVALLQGVEVLVRLLGTRFTNAIFFA